MVAYSLNLMQVLGFVDLLYTLVKIFFHSF